MTGQRPKSAGPPQLPDSVRRQLNEASRAEPPGDLLDAVMAEVRSSPQRTWYGLPRLMLALGGAVVVVAAALVIGRLGVHSPAASGPPATSASGSPSIQFTETVVNGIAGRPVGWSSDGSYFAVVQEGEHGFVDVYGADGTRIREVPGEDAAWVGPDTIAVFSFGTSTPGTGQLALLHVYGGSLEHIPGAFRSRPVGSPASGRLAIPNAGSQPFTFGLLGDGHTYVGSPLAWDESGRYLAVREETVEVGPATAVPLLVLDAQTGRMFRTAATIDDQNVSLDASGSVAAGLRLGDKYQFGLVRLDGTIVESPISNPNSSGELPDGRWLVVADGVYVWDSQNPANARRIAYGVASASTDGLVAVVRGADDPAPPAPHPGDPMLLTLEGPALFGPSWSPTGGRLFYINSEHREIRLVVLRRSAGMPNGTAPPGRAIPWTDATPTPAVSPTPEVIPPGAPASTKPSQEPQPAVVKLSLPPTAVAGETLRFTVRLTNGSAHSASLIPCPTYTENLIVSDAALKLLGEVRYFLNCSAIGNELAPGQVLLLDMQYVIPADVTPGSVDFLWFMDPGGPFDFNTAFARVPIIIVQR